MRKLIALAIIACASLLVAWLLIGRRESNLQVAALHSGHKASFPGTSAVRATPSAESRRNAPQSEVEERHVVPIAASHADAEERHIVPVDVFSGAVVETNRLTNKGRATAKDAFESFLWGLVSGRHQTVAELMGNWTRQPEEVVRRRVQERIDASAAFDQVQIVGQEPVGTDHIVLRIHFIRADSTIVRDVVMMKRVNGQWYCL